MNKHPLRRVLLLLLAALLLLPAVLCIFGFCLSAQYGSTFLGQLPTQMAQLRNAQSPRIILVGGSSVPFSLRCDYLQQAFPEHSVVVFGLYADIGTPVMLDLLEEELRPDDIVIISPEQDPQALSSYFSGESVWQAIDGHFDLLKNLSLRRFEKLLASFGVFAGKKCAYAVTGAPDPTGIYAKASFGPLGDIQSSLRQANIMSGGWDPNQQISFADDVISEEFLQILNDFSGLCSSVGAQAYYRFPPMNRSALEQTTSHRIDEYYDSLRARLDFPILGDPNRSVMDSGWFYDTNFHLNSSGATVFTKYLIEDLKLVFQDTSPTEIPLPAMPEPAAPHITDGDNSCADCFTYQKTQKGWIIDGLNEDGRSRTSLVIPVEVEGTAVVGIAADVFAGNTVLQELTVQANIGILYDGMFSGCIRLQKLILTAAQPSAYTVGDGLMEGADFRILVPEAAVDAYRRHYSWQHYSSALAPLSQ